MIQRRRFQVLIAALSLPARDLFDVQHNPKGNHMTRIGTPFNADARWSLALGDIYVGKQIQVDDGFSAIEPYAICEVRKLDGRFYIEGKEGKPFFLDEYAAECAYPEDPVPPLSPDLALHCVVEPLDVLKPMIAGALSAYSNFCDGNLAEDLEKLSPDSLEALGKALDLHRSGRETATTPTLQAHPRLS